MLTIHSDPAKVEKSMFVAAGDGVYQACDNFWGIGNDDGTILSLRSCL